MIATGVSHSVRDFVAAAFAGRASPTGSGTSSSDPALVRPADAAELRGDPARAARVLGWRPTVDFAELVRRMVDADLAG